ncbi:EF hand domain-containing protein [Novosphingobium kunmingense]|uniref:EF hand domain-containing protein n=2 Tax=Novosphingobium kunmingense TaxID=1211806 RepID=A0A2N0H7I3_9SPHN|nr:EF hand domain-containing protein [Novosphingobium kunmingense]
MKTMTKGLSIAAVALALAGVAHAQDQRGWAKPDANATITRAQAQTKAESMFDRMDANKDGKIDQADRAARQAERFARLDIDKNGQISPEEMAAGHQRKPRPDGAATGGDHAGHKMGMRGGHRGGHGGGHGGMMKMADANKDGAITKTEAVAAALAHFDKADANRDGSVTPDERKSAMAKMRAEWQAKRAAAPAAN